MAERTLRTSYAALLSKWIDDAGYTLRQVSEICKQLGRPVSFTYIGKLRSGQAESPSPEVTAILARALGYDPDPLLILQVVEKLSPDMQDVWWWFMDFTAFQAGGSQWSIESLRAAMKMVEEVLTRVEDEPAILKLPVYDQPPDDPAATPKKYISLTADTVHGAEYALRVHGGAMSDIGAWPGDLLLVRPSGWNTGTNVLVRIAGQLTARRYYAQPEPFRLEPDLFNGVPIDLRRVEFLGAVCGLIRRYPNG